jgi:two-component system phosphate regulon response regulator PhoB
VSAAVGWFVIESVGVLLFVENVSMTEILVVDDDAAIRVLLRYILHQNGYQVVLCNGLPAALDYLSRSLPRLVFCDLMLQTDSGLDLIMAIRALVPDAQLPIIAMTASSDPVLWRKACDAGANAHIIKPFDRASVSQLVAKWLKS